MSFLNGYCNVASNVEFTAPIDSLDKGEFVFIQSTASNGVSKIWYDENLNKTGYVPSTCFDAKKAIHVMKANSNVSDNAAFTQAIGSVSKGDKIGIITNNAKTCKILYGSKLDGVGYVLNSYIEEITAGTTPTPTIKYVVQAGAFSQKENADTMLNDIKSKGFDGYVKEYTENGKKIYRVQVGAFSKKENAEVLVKDLKAKGIDAFIREE